MNERQPGEPTDQEPKHEPGHKHGQEPHQGTEREHAPALRPQVWIASLSDYNAGILTGAWVDAAVEGDELAAAAYRIVAGSVTPGAEEWAIFDHDDFGGWQPGEYESLELVARVARGIQEHGAAFAAWADLVESDTARLDSFREAYLGHFATPAAWAEEVLTDLGVAGETGQVMQAIPAELRSYVSIDYGRWARDCFLNGDVEFTKDPSGGVWVFDQNA